MSSTILRFYINYLIYIHLFHVHNIYTQQSYVMDGYYYYSHSTDRKKIQTNKQTNELPEAQRDDMHGQGCFGGWWSQVQSQAFRLGSVIIT